jgi:hypothetical protein
VREGVGNGLESSRPSSEGEEGGGEGRADFFTRRGGRTSAREGNGGG